MKVPLTCKTSQVPVDAQQQQTVGLVSVFEDLPSMPFASKALPTKRGWQQIAHLEAPADAASPMVESNAHCNCRFLFPLHLHGTSPDLVICTTHPSMMAFFVKGRGVLAQMTAVRVPQSLIPQMMAPSSSMVHGTAKIPLEKM